MAQSLDPKNTDNKSLGDVMESHLGKRRRSVEKRRQQAEVSPEDRQLHDVLEQWRQYFLREGVLDKTGSKLSISELAERVPQVKELTPEHLARIRQMQTGLYRADESLEPIKTSEWSTATEPEPADPDKEVTEEAAPKDLEQWRQDLLDAGALSETGLAISVKDKELIRRFPQVKELTREDLAQIRKAQKDIYDIAHRLKKDTPSERPVPTVEKAPFNTEKFVKNVEYSDGIFVGRAENGDLLFLDPTYKQYLDRSDLELVIDRGYGTRISQPEAEEGLVESQMSVDSDLNDFDEAKAERKERKEPLSDEELNEFRLMLLEQGALDTHGRRIGKSVRTSRGLTLDIEKTLTLDERARILEMQQEESKRDISNDDTTPYGEITPMPGIVELEDTDEGPPETIQEVAAEQEEEFVIGQWYPMVIEGRQVQAKFLGTEGRGGAGALKFITEAGDRMKNQSFTSLLADKEAFRLRPEEADVARFAAQEQRKAA